LGELIDELILNPFMRPKEIYWKYEEHAGELSNNIGRISLHACLIGRVCILRHQALLYNSVI
ncbi:MAG: hypothetical protein QXK09_02645, partial [Nitrososphaerota archaeon]